MSENTSLIVAPEQRLPLFVLNAAALELKETALTGAALIGKVENAAENDAATKAQIEVKRVRALFERERKRLKEPLLEAGRQLDKLVSAESLELEKEEGRLSNLRSEFQLAEDRRIAEERRIQERELARIEAEKQAALQRIADEQARVEREAREAREAAERLASEAKNKKQREAAEAARIEAEKQSQAAREQAAIAQAQTAQVEDKAAEAAYVESRPVAATRAAGEVIKWDWEITVTNRFELARCHPDCVKIEPLLAPIKAALNAGRTVIGVEAKKVKVADVRATRSASVNC